MLRVKTNIGVNGGVGKIDPRQPINFDEQVVPGSPVDEPEEEENEDE